MDLLTKMMPVMYCTVTARDVVLARSLGLETSTSEIQPAGGQNNWAEDRNKPSFTQKKGVSARVWRWFPGQLPDPHRTRDSSYTRALRLIPHRSPGKTWGTNPMGIRSAVPAWVSSTPDSMSSHHGKRAPSESTKHILLMPSQDRILISTRHHRVIFGRARHGITVLFCAGRTPSRDFDSSRRSNHSKL
ncbi:hypothetical protein LZ31DRAFT_254302 [Colletotrichum somersetense]|nr:hypothetical protein LZ31DRAFT_254302 [Colletotrichum somersetense]